MDNFLFFKNQRAKTAFELEKQRQQEEWEEDEDPLYEDNDEKE